MNKLSQDKQLNTSTPLIYTASASSEQVLAEVLNIIDTHRLSIDLQPKLSGKKLSQKYRQQLSAQYGAPVLLIDEKSELSLLVDGVSVAPNWAKLQRRIVSAGRKSELLLQAAKLTAEQRALDATAGFGHDSLILASTGATVTMLEREPLIALLLLAEQRKMAQERNWQKLMSRLTIINSASEDYLNAGQNIPLIEGENSIHKGNVETGFDVIYLDPMFPDDSYSDSKTGKGAKVGKHMQALHELVQPPDSRAEITLFNLAQQALSYSKNKLSPLDSIVQNNVRPQKRLIVKRPVVAPYLANQLADESWQNAVVRFDGYFV